MCIMRRQHETEINRMIRMVETITLKVSIDSYKKFSLSTLFAVLNPRACSLYIHKHTLQNFLNNG